MKYKFTRPRLEDEELFQLSGYDEKWIRANYALFMSLYRNRTELNASECLILLFFFVSESIHTVVVEPPGTNNLLKYLCINLSWYIQNNTVKPNLKGLAVLPRFRDSLGLKKAKIKKNSGLDISFGSSSRCGLNVFGSTVLYCIRAIVYKIKGV